MYWLIFSLLVSSAMCNTRCGQPEGAVAEQEQKYRLQLPFKPRAIGIMSGMKFGAGARVAHFVSGPGAFSRMSDSEIGAGAHIVHAVKSSDQASGIIRGSGKKATRIIDLPIITSICSMGLGKLIIQDGDDNTVHISADDNIVDYCSATIKDTELSLNNKADFVIVTPLTYTVRLTGPRRALLASLITQSPVSITAPIGSSKLTLEHNNSNPFICEATLKLQDLIVKQRGDGAMSLAHIAIAQQFALVHSAVGSLAISGSAPHAIFNLQGMGAVDASRLRIGALSLIHAGAGLLTCCVDQTLAGVIKGEGSVENAGKSNDQGLSRVGAGSYKKVVPSES